MSAAFSLKNRACIVGVGQTEFSRPKGAGKSSLVLQLEAASAALADAGLTHKDVDGIMPFPNLATAEELAANLGVENLRFATTLQMGGAAPVASLAVLTVFSAVSRILPFSSASSAPKGWLPCSRALAAREMAVRKPAFSK